VETDELYVGMDRQGAHYLVPVQAKRGSDVLSVVQVWQDWKMGQEKFPGMICRPIAAQFMNKEVIAMFEFVSAGRFLKIAQEKHYRLVAPGALTDEELQQYRALAMQQQPL
jgi:hypothetical protein